jgi:hypothetical protein
VKKWSEIPGPWLSCPRRKQLSAADFFPFTENFTKAISDTAITAEDFTPQLQARDVNPDMAFRAHAAARSDN